MVHIQTHPKLSGFYLFSTFKVTYFNLGRATGFSLFYNSNKKFGAQLSGKMERRRGYCPVQTLIGVLYLQLPTSHFLQDHVEIRKFRDILIGHFPLKLQMGSRSFFIFSTSSVRQQLHHNITPPQSTDSIRLIYRPTSADLYQSESFLVCPRISVTLSGSAIFHCPRGSHSTTSHISQKSGGVFSRGQISNPGLRPLP